VTMTSAGRRRIRPAFRWRFRRVDGMGGVRAHMAATARETVVLGFMRIRPPLKIVAYELPAPVS